LRDNKLLVNKKLLAGDAKDFYEETVHEMAADALGVRGIINPSQLAFVGDNMTKINNALFVLENAIKEGDLKKVLKLFR
jgi:hypothetical protein